MMKHGIRIEDVTLETMQPIMCPVGEVKIANKTISEHLLERLDNLEGEILCSSNFYPSEQLLEFCQNEEANIMIVDSNDKCIMAVQKNDTDEYEVAEIDEDSLLLIYAHDLLFLLEKIVGDLKEDKIEGEIRNNVNYDGVLHLGKGSVLLPGVYIEGNVTIGENCKIGPNCYIRGNTSIGDNCHIGQAVEVKNSLLMNKVSLGHLTYMGDSIICSNVNFGAGTIGSNLRHDGQNHKTMVGGHLIDTKRRKFGCIIGEGVHTGIHTTIYPGRKMFAGSSTRPGDIVTHDFKLYISKDE